MHLMTVHENLSGSEEDRENSPCPSAPSSSLRCPDGMESAVYRTSRMWGLWMKSSGPEDVGCRSDEALQEFGVVRPFPNFIFTGEKGVHGTYALVWGG